MEKLEEKILDEYKKGNIVIAGIEGLQAMPIDEFIEQPEEGILYDLNRNESVVLTFIDDPKWVNDFAVAKTIRKLKAKVDELTALIQEGYYEKEFCEWLTLRQDIYFCGSDKHPDKYITYDNEFIENGWFTLDELHDYWLKEIDK